MNAYTYKKYYQPMRQLVFKQLNVTEQIVLNGLQEKVNDETGFTAKAKKAQTLWDSKGGVVGKAAFLIIAQELYNMCVNVGICNYCEQSEANDIEHIYPKSFFPENTFVWTNYLLACKQCNSGFKLDKCFVLNNSDDVIEVTRGNEPATKTVALINPRLEDPNQYMLLNLFSFKFDIIPGLSKKDINKAQKTLEILQLNNRDILIATRKNAAMYYYQRMKLLIDILNTKTIAEIEQLLTPYDNLVDNTKTLLVIKSEFKESFKKHVSTYQHPSVWYSIKTIQSKIDAKWRNIFDTLPEALNW
jgi:uncharacterized protein (TIGR02646 family)